MKYFLYLQKPIKNKASAGNTVSSQKKTKFSKTKHKALFLCELDMGSVQVRNRVVYRFEIQKALGLQSFLMFSGVRMESVIFFKGPIAIEGF